MSMYSITCSVHLSQLTFGRVTVPEKWAVPLPATWSNRWSARTGKTGGSWNSAPVELPMELVVTLGSGGSSERELIESATRYQPGCCRVSSTLSGMVIPPVAGVTLFDAEVGPQGGAPLPPSVAVSAGGGSTRLKCAS